MPAGRQKRRAVAVVQAQAATEAAAVVADRKLRRNLVRPPGLGLRRQQRLVAVCAVVDVPVQTWFWRLRKKAPRERLDLRERDLQAGSLRQQHKLQVVDRPGPHLVLRIEPELRRRAPVLKVFALADQDPPAETTGGSWILGVQPSVGDVFAAARVPSYRGRGVRLGDDRPPSGRRRPSNPCAQGRAGTAQRSAASSQPARRGARHRTRGKISRTVRREGNHQPTGC